MTKFHERLLIAAVALLGLNSLLLLALVMRGPSAQERKYELVRRWADLQTMNHEAEKEFERWFVKEGENGEGTKRAKLEWMGISDMISDTRYKLFP